MLVANNVLNQEYFKELFSVINFINWPFSYQFLCLDFFVFILCAIDRLVCSICIWKRARASSLFILSSQKELNLVFIFMTIKSAQTFQLISSRKGSVWHSALSFHIIEFNRKKTHLVFLLYHVIVYLFYILTVEYYELVKILKIKYPVSFGTVEMVCTNLC